MRKWPLILSLSGVLSSCNRPTSTLTEQLTVAFSHHLSRIDPGVRLDSVHLLWSVPVTERLGRVIDDTVYVREYHRIRSQMAGALQRNDRDSIAFYRYEIAVLEREIDSISKAIGQGDTTRRYGSLLSAAYYLEKEGHTLNDSTLLYIDTSGVLRYTGYMDSSIARTIRSK